MAAATAEVPTSEFDLSLWVPPVETTSELWACAREGQLCFVKDIGKVFVRVAGSWVQRSE